MGNHKRGGLQKATLCWNCANACGNCPWSKKLEPIENWEATPTIVYSADKSIGALQSYFITKCPLFIRDKEISILPQTAYAEANELGLNIRTYYRIKHEKLERLKEILQDYEQRKSKS